MNSRIAILWDFEPLHDAVMTLEYGKYWYRNMGDGEQPEAVDVRGLIDFAMTKGEVALNIAYANWHWLGSYATTFRQHEVRLIQLFPEGRTNQNNAPNEMEADLKSIFEKEGIDTILIIGADGRYAHVAERIKAEEKNLIGIGVKDITDQTWQEACSEYLFYSDVARPLKDNFATFKNVEESHKPLIDTMLALTAQYGEEWIQQVRIKPALARTNPDFQEKDYGYPSFGTYLSDQTSVLERRHLKDEQEPEYRIRPDLELSEQATRIIRKATNTQDQAPYYLRVAAQQGVRMPRPDIMWIGVDIYASFLEDDCNFPSFAELDDECLYQLQKDIPSATLTDAKKIRQVLFKCYIFRPSEDGSIGFHDGVQTLEDVENRYFNLMLARIGNNIREEIDFEAMSRALTDGDGSADRLRQLYAEM